MQKIHDEQNVKIFSKDRLPPYRCTAHLTRLPLVPDPEYEPVYKIGAPPASAHCSSFAYHAPVLFSMSTKVPSSPLAPRPQSTQTHRSITWLRVFVLASLVSVITLFTLSLTRAPLGTPLSPWSTERRLPALRGGTGSCSIFKPQQLAREPHTYQRDEAMLRGL